MTIQIPTSDVHQIIRDEFDGAVIQLKTPLDPDCLDEGEIPPFQAIYVDNSITIIVKHDYVMLEH